METLKKKSEGKTNKKLKSPNVSSANSKLPRKGLSKPEQKNAQRLHSLGVSMTNIHLILGEKNKDLNYYDVWKAVREK